MNASIAVCAIAWASSNRSFWKMPTCSNSTVEAAAAEEVAALAPDEAERAAARVLPATNAPRSLDDVGVEAAAQALVAGDDDDQRLAVASGARARSSSG